MKQIPVLANLIPLLLLTTLAAACTSPAAAPPTPAPSAGPTVALDLSPSPRPSLVEPDPFAEKRADMVQDGLIAWGITDPAVLQVMGQVPRHEFIPADMSHLAYQNHPLPIGYGQTISQPYIVALMTEALDVMTGDKVLEIGTGSGYQAAVLSRLVDCVFTIEIIDPLAQRAAEAHQRVGYGNITGRTADGYYGWPEEAPFDAIIVTAAPDHIPQPLVQQLKIGGRLVIPVGPIGGVQTLWLITRTGEESVQTENLGDVRFVPFTRDPGVHEDDGLSGPAE